MVCGIGESPGVKGLSCDPAGDRFLLDKPSGTTSSSSGTASCSRFSYASVPGTSPCWALSSTRSIRVRGTGEARLDGGRDLLKLPSLASEKWSSSLLESCPRRVNSLFLPFQANNGAQYHCCPPPRGPPSQCPYEGFPDARAKGMSRPTWWRVQAGIMKPGRDRGITQKTRLASSV
jgi:hypothetical protein